MKKCYLLPMTLLTSACIVFSCGAINDSREEVNADDANCADVLEPESANFDLLYADASIDALEETTAAAANSEGSEQSELYVDKAESKVSIENEIDTPRQSYFDVPLSEDLQDYIFILSSRFNVPTAMIIAIIDMESSFSADVISETKDYGFMQINECNHESLREELGITDILDPYENVLAGTYIYAKCMEAANGDYELALMCYHCGQTGAKRLWEKGVYSTDYSRAVMELYEMYCLESRK